MSDAPAATAVKGIAAAALRHAVTAAGVALAARGVIDAQTASRATGPIVEGMMGVAAACGAAGWSMLRAWITHSRYAVAWARLTGTNFPGAVAGQEGDDAMLKLTLKDLLHTYGPALIALAAKAATDAIERSKLASMSTGTGAAASQFAEPLIGADGRPVAV